MTNLEIENLVYNYPTKSQYGFLPNELKDIISKFPNINMKKFDDAMMGNTCMMDEDTQEAIMYHCDVYKAIICGIENRKLKHLS